MERFLDNSELTLLVDFYTEDMLDSLLEYPGNVEALQAEIDNTFGELREVLSSLLKIAKELSE